MLILNVNDSNNLFVECGGSRQEEYLDSLLHQSVARLTLPP